MTPYDWSDRKVKDTVRTALFDYLKVKLKGRPLSSYLCLPGWDGKTAGLDIQRGIAAGVINGTTKVLGYEIRKDWAACIRKYFRKSPNVCIKTGSIEYAKLEPNSVEFAFLDFTGVIDNCAQNNKLYHWLEQTFAPSLRDEASFAITLPFGRNTGQLFEHTRQRLNGDLKHYAQFLANKFPAIWFDQPLIATWLFILKCALRTRENYFRDILLYHDENKVPMLVFLFEGVKPQPDAQYPALTPTRKEEHRMTKRSKTAVKAQRTHATNGLAAKRSNAAKKAWRTRRAQA